MRAREIPDFEIKKIRRDYWPLNAYLHKVDGKWVNQVNEEFDRWSPETDQYTQWEEWDPNLVPEEPPWPVEVVEIQSLDKHPNADSLSIAKVKGWSCIVKTDDFKDVKKAVYIPIDSVVPDSEEWSWLKGHRRIRTIKLRGVISQGMLVKANDDWEIGKNVAKELGIIKYEPCLRNMPMALGGDCVRPPTGFFIYTKIQNHKNYPDIIRQDEEVVVTEKRHGTNSRYTIIDDIFYVGSHHTTKRESPASTYWRAARDYDIEAKLRSFLKNAPQNGTMIIYGEIFGAGIQKHFDYGFGEKLDGAKPGFELFDISVDGKYLDYDIFLAYAAALNLPTVPLIYRGPFGNGVLELASGKATGAKHIREGIVIKPAIGRWDYTIGRVIVKRISEEYELKADNTDWH